MPLGSRREHVARLFVPGLLQGSIGRDAHGGSMLFHHSSIITLELLSADNCVCHIHESVRLAFFQKISFHSNMFVFAGIEAA